jgi:hypothetical protein
MHPESKLVIDKSDYHSHGGDNFILVAHSLTPIFISYIKLSHQLLRRAI